MKSAVASILENPASRKSVFVKSPQPVKSGDEQDVMLADLVARMDAGEIFFPHQFFHSIRRTVAEDLSRLHRMNRDLSLQKVVAIVFSGFKTNQQFPPDEVMKLTRFILDEWEKLSQPTS